MDSGRDCGIVLRHALAEAGELWRRCMVNKQRPKDAAKAMGLPPVQCRGVVRLLKKFGKVPTPERLASIAMRDWGLEDADIAEMFGRSEKWASMVRAHIDELRQTEPIDPYYEYVDEGLRPGDPCPEEIYRRAAEIRAKRPPDFGKSISSGKAYKAMSQPGMRHYLWNGGNVSFFSALAPHWTGR